MCGHISLPDYQGMADDIDNALPATLCKKLMTDLLRKELGFQGVIVSDAFPMVGFTCMFPEDELAWRNIEAGCDSVLFADPRRDFKPMMEALKSGRYLSTGFRKSVDPIGSRSRIDSGFFYVRTL